MWCQRKRQQYLGRLLQVLAGVSTITKSYSFDAHSINSAKRGALATLMGLGELGHE